MHFEARCVRTDYDTPSFIEGREDEIEFISGYDFEDFMFGYHSTSFFLRIRQKIFSFREEVNKASIWSVENCKTYSYLTRKRQEPFICKIYREIKDNLPKNLRSYLRMYVTVNTVLDFVYGVDVMFLFKGNIVTVDVTLDPFNKKRIGRSNHLIFSHYNLSQRETNKFSKKVVRLLTKKES